MNPQFKNNLDLFKEVATRTNSGSDRTKVGTIKIKSATIKDDGLVSMLRNKKDATVFMSQLTAIIKNSK